jgi:hypothetical protein
MENTPNIGFFAESMNGQVTELLNLRRRTDLYKEILSNTENYRKAWGDGLRQMLHDSLIHMASTVGLSGEVVLYARMENLEAVQFTLGSSLSGMTEEVSKNVHRSLIKHNGSLVFQQLFNGKIMVAINFPFIEGYGQPTPPKNLAIYRPEELKAPYLIRHMEEFVQAITNWEDFDDDEPRENSQTIGFKLNFDAEQAIKTNG